MSEPWFFADVAFDPAAVADTVAALDRAVLALEDVTAARWRTGVAALEPCRGPFADELTATLAARCADGAVLVDALRALSNRIAAAGAAAAEEQRHREGLRRVWEAELHRDRQRALAHVAGGRS